MLVAAGGACGAVARYGMVSVSSKLGLGFPWGTALTNIVGCFAIGFVLGAYAGAEWFVDFGRSFLVVGILGGFTTFSAFSMETLMLIDADQWGMASVYVLVSVAVCLLAAWAGQSAAA